MKLFNIIIGLFFGALFLAATAVSAEPVYSDVEYQLQEIYEQKQDLKRTLQEDKVELEQALKDKMRELNEIQDKGLRKIEKKKAINEYKIQREGLLSEYGLGLMNLEEKAMNARKGVDDGLTDAERIEVIREREAMLQEQARQREIMDDINRRREYNNRLIEKERKLQKKRAKGRVKSKKIEILDDPASKRNNNLKNRGSLLPSGRKGSGY